MIHAYATPEAGGKLDVIEFDPGELAPDSVEIDIHYCGVCHSDLSMLKNEFGITEFPFVPGHEVAGTVAAKGESVTHLEVGQKVGLGWFSRSCMTCTQCMTGNHNLCPSNEQTIVSRHGGFADKVRCQATWATPLPDALDWTKAGPMFCGGITVFNPIVQFGVQPTDRVGVIGIGGLGHLALQFLNKWGCEVVAFTSSESKQEEARKLGAHSTINSRDADAVAAAQGTFDFILCTANADLNWDSYINALAPKGRLHFVGLVPSPVGSHVFPMMVGQKAISASPLGSPATTTAMLDFAARHEILPVTEEFPMSQVNEALEHLEAGKARYRIVLKNDLGN